MDLLFLKFNSTILAEGEGFEPSVRFTARRFSRPVPSTTRSPFQKSVHIIPHSCSQIKIPNP